MTSHHYSSEGPDGGARQRNHQVRVWDPLVRFGHWLLAASFLISYVTSEEIQSVHVWAGYVVGSYLAIRLVWGFVGTRHARFSDFVFAPVNILSYASDLVRGRGRHYTGHNPLGGAMVVCLMLMLTLTAFSGTWLLAVEEGRGPLVGWVQGASSTEAGQTAAKMPSYLSEEGHHADRTAREARHEMREGRGHQDSWLEEVHEVLANLTLSLVVLHVLGVLVSSLLERENLVRAMWTGYKRRRATPHHS